MTYSALQQTLDHFNLPETMVAWDTTEVASDSGGFPHPRIIFLWANPSPQTQDRSACKAVVRYV